MRRRRKTPVIYLIGTSGHPNYGDELITATWLKFWAREAPHAEVWLDSPRPGPSAVLFEGLHPGLRCVDTLFHASWNAHADQAADTIDFGARVVGDAGLIPREATGVELLQRVDLVQIIGGGYINALWPHHQALLGAVREMGQSYGSRTALTGAGLTPVAAGGDAALVAALRDFDIVDVRDVASFDVVREGVPQVTCTGDDAFLGLNDVQCDSSRREPTILCIQSDFVGQDLAEVTDFVVRTLRSWSVDQDPVLLVECMPPDDGEARRFLQPHLPQLSFLPFAGLWRNGFPVTPGACWISTRFHPHLIAASKGSRGLAISPPSGYYATKHQSLASLGSGWSMVESLGDPPPPPDPAPDPFAGRLAAIQEQKAALASRVAALLHTV